MRERDRPIAGMLPGLQPITDPQRIAELEARARVSERIRALGIEPITDPDQLRRINALSRPWMTHTFKAPEGDKGALGPLDPGSRAMKHVYGGEPDLEGASLPGDFWKGLKMGGRGVVSGLAGTSAMLGGRGLGLYDTMTEQTAKDMISTPEFTSLFRSGFFDEIGQRFREGAHWAAGQAGALLPIVGSILAGAKAGSLVGAKTGAFAGPKGAVVGAIAGSAIGAFKAGYVLYAGSMYGDLRKAGAGHEEAAKAAALYAIPASAVSIVVPGAAYASVAGYLGKTFTRNYVKNMFRGAVIGGVMESMAEGAAEAFVIAGEESVLGVQMTTRQKHNRIINAASAGGLMGLGSGATGGGFQKRGDITTITDALFNEAEKQGPNPLMASLLTEYLENAQDKTKGQEQVLKFLKERKADKDKPIRGELKKAQEMAVRAVQMSEQESGARLSELGKKAQDGTITGDQALELAVIMANRHLTIRKDGTFQLNDFPHAAKMEQAGEALKAGMEPLLLADQGSWEHALRPEDIDYTMQQLVDLSQIASTRSVLEAYNTWFGTAMAKGIPQEGRAALGYILFKALRDRGTIPPPPPQALQGYQDQGFILQNDEFYRAFWDAYAQGQQAAELLADPDRWAPGEEGAETIFVEPDPPWGLGDDVAPEAPGSPVAEGTPGVAPPGQKAADTTAQAKPEATAKDPWTLTRADLIDTGAPMPKHLVGHPKKKGGIGLLGQMITGEPMKKSSEYLGMLYRTAPGEYQVWNIASFNKGSATRLPGTFSESQIEFRGKIAGEMMYGFKEQGAQAPAAPPAKPKAPPAKPKFAGDPLRYDPDTDRHGYRTLVRGDVFMDAEGNKYALDRKLGFILQLDTIDAGGNRKAGPAYSVDPADKTRFKDLWYIGENVYEPQTPIAKPETPAKPVWDPARPETLKGVRGHWNGDAIEFTGKTVRRFGADFHEFTFLEGPNKGETGVTSKGHEPYVTEVKKDERVKEAPHDKEKTKPPKEEAPPGTDSEAGPRKRHYHLLSEATRKAIGALERSYARKNSPALAKGRVLFTRAAIKSLRGTDQSHPPGMEKLGQLLENWGIAVAYVNVPPSAKGYANGGIYYQAVNLGIYARSGVLFVNTNPATQSIVFGSSAVILGHEAYHAMANVFPELGTAMKKAVLDAHKGNATFGKYLEKLKKYGYTNQDMRLEEAAADAFSAVVSGESFTRNGHDFTPLDSVIEVIRNWEPDLLPPEKAAPSPPGKTLKERGKESQGKWEVLDQGIDDVPENQQWQAAVPDDGRISEGYWEVVDVETPITSDKEGYRGGLQERIQRNKNIQSSVQIGGFKKEIRTVELGESGNTRDGAPILLPTDEAVNNGRIMGIREAYRANTESSHVYREWVLKQAEKRGLSVRDIESPLLIRRVTNTAGMDVQVFARLSNAASGIPVTKAEKAISDARVILEMDILGLFAPGADGKITAASNNEFLDAFIKHVGDPSLRNAKGGYADTIPVRVKNAMLAVALGSSGRGQMLVEILLDSAENYSLVNVREGLMDAAPKIAELAAHKPSRDITPHLSQAVEALFSFRIDLESGKIKTLEQFMAKGDLFGDRRTAEADRILRWLNGAKTAKQIRNVLNYFSETAVREMSVSDTMSIFGEKPRTNIEILEEAIKHEEGRRAREKADKEQKDKTAQKDQGLFEEPQSGRGYRPPTAPEVLPHDIPDKTIKAYKLMRVQPSRPGQLLPLYAKDVSVEGARSIKGYIIGKWHKAESQLVEIFSKPLADRPGIHGMMLPIFDQGKVRRAGETRVWVEVEMPAIDAETQRAAGKTGLRGAPPGVDKAYNFATNPKATEAGGWPIAGSVKIVRVLTDADVASVLRAAGKDAFVERSMTGLPADAIAKMNRPDSLSPETVEHRFEYGGVHYDVSDGLGSVPIQANVHYMGYTTFMTASEFLGLNPVRRDPLGKTHAEKIRAGDGVAPPWLYGEVDPDTKTIRVKQHEGRGRAGVLREMVGDGLIPVTIFGQGEYNRARFLPEDVHKYLILPDKRTIGGRSVKQAGYVKANDASVPPGRPGQDIYAAEPEPQMMMGRGPSKVNQQDMQEWINRSETQRALHRDQIRNPRRILDLMLNKFHSDLFLFRERLRKTVGELPHHLNPAKLMQQFRGWSGVADWFLTKDVSRFDDTTKRIGESLMDIVHDPKYKIPLHFDVFNYWLVARRIVGLYNNPRTRKHFFTEGGMERADAIEEYKKAKRIYDDYSKKRPEWIEAAERLTAYNNSLVDYLVSAGNLTRAQAQTIKETHPEYVPLEILDLIGSEGSASSQNVRRALKTMGKVRGGQAYEMPLNSMVSRTHTIVRVAHENWIRVKLAQQIQAFGEQKHDGEPALGWFEDPKNVPVFKRAKELVEAARKAKGDDSPRQIRKELVKEYGDILGKDEIDIIMHMVGLSHEGAEALAKLWVHSSFQERGMVSFVWQGETKWMRVNNDVYEALTKQPGAQAESVLKNIAFITKWMRAGAILSPDFVTFNPIRDLMQVIVQAPHFVNWKKGPIRGAGDLFMAMSGIRSMQGFLSVIKKDKWYRGWVLEKGGMAHHAARDMRGAEKMMQELLQQNKGKLRYVLIKHPLFALQTLSGISEAGSRVAVTRKAFNELMDTGKYTEAQARQLAAFESRESSLDYSDMGSLIAPLNTLTAFLNANIRGYAQLMKTFANKDTRANATINAVMAILLPSVLLWAINRDKEWYKEQPRWLKNSSWLWSTDGGETIRIHPKPFEMGLIWGSFAERALEQLAKDDPKALEEWLRHLTSSIPSNILPMLLGVVEGYADFSFWRGEPIVGGRLGNVPKELQYTPHTSELAKLVGKGMGISPMHVDNWINTSFAGLGRYATNLVDIGLHGLKGDLQVAPWEKNFLQSVHKPERQSRLDDIPGIKRFQRGQPRASTRYVSDFYDYLLEAERAAAGYNNIIKGKATRKEMAWLLERDLFWLAVQPVLSESARAISQLTGSIRVIENPDLQVTPARRRELLDQHYEARNRYTKLVVEKIDELRRDRKKWREMSKGAADRIRAAMEGK